MIVGVQFLVRRMEGLMGIYYLLIFLHIDHRLNFFDDRFKGHTLWPDLFSLVQDDLGFSIDLFFFNDAGISGLLEFGVVGFAVGFLYGFSLDLIGINFLIVHQLQLTLGF